MPLGIVSDDDFLLELEKLKAGKSQKKEKSEPTDKTKENEQNEPKVLPIDKGRGLNNVAVPDQLRALIASTAIESGRLEALELARQFGISPSSVSAYTNGSTSTASYHDSSPPLKKKIEATKERLGRVARGKLGLSLKHITAEKLAEAKLRDVAAVASAMSAVVKNMEPDNDRNSNTNVNIVLYAPKIKSEEQYEVIDLQAQSE